MKLHRIPPPIALLAALAVSIVATAQKPVSSRPSDSDTLRVDTVIFVSNDTLFTGNAD